MHLCIHSIAYLKAHKSAEGIEIKVDVSMLNECIVIDRDEYVALTVMQLFDPPL